MTALQKVSADFRKQLKGYGLTTAHIHYFFPDYPHVVSDNWILWQEYDVCPDFPALNKYLNYWLEEIEGPLCTVTVAHSRLIKPVELKVVKGAFRLN